MQLNRKEFLGLVTRGAVAFGASTLPWARLRAEPPGPVMATLSAYMSGRRERGRFPRGRRDRPSTTSSTPSPR